LSVEDLVVVFIVLSAIDFDDESGRETGKIDDVTADWYLSSEPIAAQLSPTKVKPELLLGISHVSPESTCSVDKEWVVQHEVNDFASFSDSLVALQDSLRPPPGAARHPPPRGRGDTSIN
jgi:hypothetical protein